MVMAPITPNRFLETGVTEKNINFDRTAKASNIKFIQVVMPDLVNLCSGHKIFQWLCYSAIPVVDCEICEELLEL